MNRVVDGGERRDWVARPTIDGCVDAVLLRTPSLLIRMCSLHARMGPCDQCQPARCYALLQIRREADGKAGAGRPHHRCVLYALRLPWLSKYCIGASSVAGRRGKYGQDTQMVHVLMREARHSIHVSICCIQVCDTGPYSIFGYVTRLIATTWSLMVFPHSG